MSELDIKAALKERYLRLNAASVFDAAVDYLQSAGENTSDLASVDLTTVDFYDEYDLLITDFSYGTTTKNLSDLMAHEQTYENTSPDDPLEATFTYSYTRQDAQSFKFTEGLKVGASAKFKAELPLIGGAETTVSAEVSFAAEQTIATTTTSQWQFSEKITVKPNSAVHAKGFVQVAKVNAPFTCNVRVTGGKVLVWFKLKTTGYTETPIPITDIMGPDDLAFLLTGNLDGSMAASTYVKVEPATLAARA